MDDFTLIGKTHVGNMHAENQDRITKRKLDSQLANREVYIIGVADGISQCSFGGSVARWIIEKHLAVDPVFEVTGKPLATQFENYLRELYGIFQDEFSDFEDMLSSGATLSAAIAAGPHADCFWAGDSPIYYSELINDGYLTKRISKPDIDTSGLLTDCFGAHAEFRLKHNSVEMRTGSVLTITSDGAALDADLLSHLYNTLGFDEAVNEEVMSLSLAGQYADDVSFVAICRNNA